MPGRVFITRRIPEPGPSLVAEVADEVAANPHDRPLAPEELRAAVAGRDAVLCLLTDRIDAEVLDAARGCHVFANMAVGYNNIDVAAATARGILVTNTPGVLTDVTADLTWALILAVARRVVDGDREMRAGRFPGWGPLYMLGGDVTGRTLGLVGPGRIAAAVAGRAAGFRMRLLYHGRRSSPALEALGAEAVGLDRLLAESDFVSLHVPLTARDAALDRRDGAGHDEIDGLPDQHIARAGRRRTRPGRRAEGRDDRRRGPGRLRGRAEDGGGPGRVPQRRPAAAPGQRHPRHPGRHGPDGRREPRGRAPRPEAPEPGQSRGPVRTEG
jgi:hypothetical protein